MQAIGYDSKQLAEWMDAIESGKGITVGIIDEIGDAVSENSAKWDELDKILEVNQEQLASTAKDLDELHQMLKDGVISTEAFTKAANCSGVP